MRRKLNSSKLKVFIKIICKTILNSQLNILKISDNITAEGSGSTNIADRGLL
tara:strand:+ start:357 stop:512 length:156 start_codon:yes stop_codon:yes gene_type:complete